MKAILVRHGQSEWNEKKLTQGHSGGGLTELGREQAKAMAEKVCKIGVSKIFASDLIRASETAGFIAEKCGLTVTENDGLREICLGEWEGRPYVAMNDIENFAYDWRHRPTSIKPPDGETFQEMQNRVVSTFEEIASQCEEKDVFALVSHGGALGALMAYVADEPLDNLWTFLHGNCDYTVLSQDETGKWHIDESAAHKAEDRIGASFLGA